MKRRGRSGQITQSHEMKSNKVRREFFMVFVLLLMLFPFCAKSVSAEETKERYEFESVHLQYDEEVYKLPEKPEYPYEVPLREMLKRFNVTIYQDQAFSYEDSITVPQMVINDQRTIEGSGTLKLNGNIVYEYDTVKGYPHIEGTLHYTAKVTDIDGYLDDREKTEYEVECTGPFRLHTPMLDYYTESDIYYGGALQDNDINHVEKTIYYKDGKIYHEAKEAGYFGIAVWFGAQTKLINTEADITPEAETEEPKEIQKPVVQIENTEAEETAGETAISLIAVIITGVAAAAVGAGAAGAAAGSAGGAVGKDSGGGQSEEAPGSTYKMILKKDFGNAIRVGAEPVRVKARMVEVTAQGMDMERPDLTAAIEVFSPDNTLAVSDVLMRGNEKQASVQAPGGRAAISNKQPGFDTGTVSFRYTGEGGMFQNNVQFRLVGESKIKLESNKLPILATSAENFELIYELVDFVTKPEVELEYQSDLFELETGKNKTGQTVIVARPTPKAAQMNFHRFIHRYACEIIAKNEKETVKEKFELHLCYEGIGTAYKDCRNNTTPDEIILTCFPEKEKDKREENAFHLPLAVMQWNPTSRKLEPEPALAEKLTLEFTAHTGSGEINAEAAIQTVKDAKIKAVVESGAILTNLDDEKKPAIYKIYPEESPSAGAAEIDMILAMNSDGDKFETFTLKAKLKPLHDYKAMVKWLLEYPKGTYVEKYLKIGDVTTYFGALDFIENRVYSMSKVPFKPRTKENHYEDGVLDVRRPTAVVLQDASMPEKIGEFEKILSLVHELTHTIEHRHGDTGGDNPERHTYFIENLAKVVKTLTDLERNPSLDAEKYANDAILYFHEVFFNRDNAEPQTFSWFGTEYQTQHKVFDSYTNFDLFATESSLPDARKRQIAAAFKNRYFPGNLKGNTSVSKFRQTDGFFKDLVWEIKWYNGVLGQLDLVHSDFAFKRKNNWQWAGGREMKLTMTLDIESKKNGRTDTLTVEIDAGTFDPNDYHYPIVNQFTVTWKATDRISDCIMGSPSVKCTAVKE